ncbi:MAG: hypothetical protein E7256_10955 [Lachnospiraceae bacterium]|nr:hypothetical protein [Lachnospiraceae bacterium]
MIEWHYFIKNQENGERVCNIDIEAVGDYKRLFGNVLESDLLKDTNPFVKIIAKGAKNCFSNKMIEHVINKNADTISSQVNKILKKQSDETGMPCLKMSKRI